MKNITNIYDIDGELIRAAGDNHEMTIEEAQEKIKHYQDVLNSNENTELSDKQITAYKTYIRNLHSYILNMYANMPKDDLIKALSKKSNNKTTQEQVEEAIEQLKKDIENDENTGVCAEDEVQGGDTINNEGNTDKEPGDDTTGERTISDVHEGEPTTQSDLLVERDDVTTNMDEYVEYEEV